MEWDRHEHFGVYCLIWRSRELLLVKKTDGPYSGYWDLPGGGPESGESPEETLQREALEELGCGVVISSRWAQICFHVTQDSVGRDIHLVHKALVCLACVVGAEDHVQTSSDTAGSAWIDLTRNVDRDYAISPLVKEALALEFELL